MAVYKGTAGQVTDISFNAIEEVKEWSIEISQSPIDVTSFSEEWNRSIAGIRNFSGSFSANLDSTDGYQEAWIEQIQAGNAGTIDFRFTVLAGVGFRGTALITGVNTSIAYDGVSQLTFSFTGTQDVEYF